MHAQYSSRATSWAQEVKQDTQAFPGGLTINVFCTLMSKRRYIKGLKLNPHFFILLQRSGFLKKLPLAF